MTIVAPGGCPLAAAVLSTANLDATLAFYRDRIGFRPVGEPTALGPHLAALLGSPDPLPGRGVLLDAGQAVGRLLLLEWRAAHRERIRTEAGTRAYGLQNLNFYVPDARAAAAELAAAGCVPWSEPTRHAFNTNVGAPVEVILEGPDGVAINLVELAGRDPATRIGQMRAYVERTGYTAQGYTPVVTTSHVVRSIDTAVAFARDVLGQGVLIDDVLHTPAANRFLRLPAEARTRVTFLQGDHMYGKVALSEPLNYACEELAPRARAPNVGYLAQGYVVRDLPASRAAAARHGVRAEAEADGVDVPGFGTCAAAVVRFPGSGAPILLLANGAD